MCRGQIFVNLLNLAFWSALAVDIFWLYLMKCFQVNIIEVTVEIPQKLHTAVIGAKGYLIREISEDCGGVLIRFPSENAQSDKVHLRGPKDEVEKAKKRLLEVASDRVSDGSHNFFLFLTYLPIFSLSCLNVKKTCHYMLASH